MVKLILILFAICIILAFKEFFIGIAVFALALFLLLIFLQRKGILPQQLTAGNAGLISSGSYVVVDIETTGFSRKNDRIIEIAANKYINGQLIDQYHTYINPGVPILPYVTQLTGITNNVLKDAPSIQQIKKEFLSFIGSSPLVGHNIISFDIPFLREQLGVDIKNKAFDTLSMAKKTFPGLPSYKLTYLNQALHLLDLEHHRAENDILITNVLYQACLHPKEYLPFLEDKEALANIKVEPRGSFYRSVDIHSFHPSNPDSLANTPLTGKNIVFSGYFNIPLDQMMQMAVDAGATLKSSVSMKVDYLVVGEQDWRFADEEGDTSKSRTAKKLIQQSDANIQIIDENTFIELTKQIN